MICCRNLLNYDILSSNFFVIVIFASFILIIKKFFGSFVRLIYLLLWNVQLCGIEIGSLILSSSIGVWMVCLFLKFLIYEINVLRLLKSLWRFLIITNLYLFPPSIASIMYSSISIIDEFNKWYVKLEEDNL